MNTDCGGTLDLLLEGFLTALAEVFIFLSLRRWKRIQLRDFRVVCFYEKDTRTEKGQEQWGKKTQCRVRTALPQSGLIDVSRQWAGYQKGRISY